MQPCIDSCLSPWPVVNVVVLVVAAVAAVAVDEDGGVCCCCFARHTFRC